MCTSKILYYLISFQVTAVQAQLVANKHGLFYNETSLRFRSDGKASGAVVGIDLGTTNSCVAVMEGTCTVTSAHGRRALIHEIYASDVVAAIQYLRHSQPSSGVLFLNIDCYTWNALDAQFK